MVASSAAPSEPPIRERRERVCASRWIILSNVCGSTLITPFFERFVTPRTVCMRRAETARGACVPIHTPYTAIRRSDASILSRDAHPGDPAPAGVCESGNCGAQGLRAARLWCYGRLSQERQDGGGR